MAVLFALVLVSGAAHAQSQDDLARAKTHYEAGHALYNLGNYTEAQREFAAGYQLVPRPGFLLNLGQCARKLGDLRRAKEMYQRFLSAIPDKDPERGDATQVLAELDRQIAEQPVVTPTPLPEPKPAIAHPVAPEAIAVTPALSVETSAPPPRKSWIKRNWWVIPVGAVVVGAGVGLGVYFGTKPASACKSGDLACWNLSNPQ
ncbi:MAG TPA: tetratricopeptide repeat protein [Polyangia bacterium]|nr:tetratricopeptide repeat protein [Polyangia bacterium]